MSPGAFGLDLTNDPIPTLIRRLAVPASVGYFFNTMYNVVDTYWGGAISTTALAALSLTFSVFFIIMATGSGLSTGATALIATALGAKEREKAETLAAGAVSFGVIVAVALTILGWFASPFLFRILGAQGEYLDTAVSYMRTIFLGSVFFLLVQMFNSVLQSQGDTRTFRNLLIIAFLLNVGLDPLLIYGAFGIPGLGFSGIALATVLVHVVGSIYMGYRAVQTGLITLARPRDFLPRRDVIRTIAYQGFPASFSMLTIGLGIFVIQYFISRFGPDGVAAYGTGMRVEQIALLPTIGLNVAVLTLTAQNHGARRYERIFETINTALKWGAIMMVVGGILVFLLSGTLMGLFTDDKNVIDIGALYLKIDALVLYAYVVLFVHVGALQGIKRPMYAIWIGLTRQIVAPLIVFYLLSIVFGWELLGVWWGIFVVTWSAALFTVFYSRRLLKKELAASGTQATPGRTP